MYSVYAFGKMISDSGRMDAYVEALRSATKPGCVVVDIGTGTGVFALLACQFGARKVYAIEPDDAIIVAQQIAAANGYDDRIEFHQDLSTNIDLPEKADVIISDLRGVLPLFQQHIPSIIDARKRFLAPNGVLIPQQDILYATIVESDELYQPYTNPWNKNKYNLDIRAGQKIVTNTWRKAHITPDKNLAEPTKWVELDYTSIKNVNIREDITFTIERSSIAHGLNLWFDTVLYEDIGFSNSPEEPDLIYGNAFFPFSEPITVEVDDTIEVSLQANLVGEDYIWNWNTRVLRDNLVKANFKQSTFYGVPLSPKRLRKRASDFVPTLNEQGEIDHLCLELMSKRISLEEIANRLTSSFPAKFNSFHQALTYVSDLSQKYSS